jgi:ribosomal small subunit protein bTHX
MRMGKGDKSTKRGKLSRGTYGKARHVLRRKKRRTRNKTAITSGKT